MTCLVLWVSILLVSWLSFELFEIWCKLCCLMIVSILFLFVQSVSNILCAVLFESVSLLTRSISVCSCSGVILLCVMSKFDLFNWVVSVLVI